MRGQYDKAVAAYDEALTAPEIADFIEASIYSDRGVAKWRMNQTKEAIEDFNKSIQLSPENATVYNNRGNALMDLGHPDEAVKDFDRAIALSASYGAAYNNRGNARVTLGQYDAAFQDFRKAVELMPQSAVPFNGRGMAHEQLKRHHAAIRDLTRAISINPKYVAAYQHRADAYLALGMYREAAADATQVLTLQPDVPLPDILLLRARANAGDKKFNAALDDLNKAIEAKPDLVDAYIERGIVFTQARRFDDAFGDLTRAIELDPQNAKAYAMRASVKLQAAPNVTSNAEGNAQANDDALNDVNQALQIAANDPVALRIRGNIYEALNRTDEGIADYKNALAQDPFQAESREALVRLGQEVPPEQGRPLGEEVAGWVIKEPQPGRYVASNAKYPALRPELEMFGAGKPKILEWKLLEGRALRHRPAEILRRRFRRRPGFEPRICRHRRYAREQSRSPSSRMPGAPRRRSGTGRPSRSSSPIPTAIRTRFSSARCGRERPSPATISGASSAPRLRPKAAAPRAVVAAAAVAVAEAAVAAACSTGCSGDPVPRQRARRRGSRTGASAPAPTSSI